MALDDNIIHKGAAMGVAANNQQALPWDIQESCRCVLHPLPTSVCPEACISAAVEKGFAPDRR